MFKKHVNRLFHLALLLVVSPVSATDLELKCRPIFGLEDFRSVRPDYTRDVTASYTYYLFDNADLLHYRVRLVNNGPEPVRVGDLDWPEGLRVELSRDGVALEPGAVRLDLLRRTVIDTRYYLEGEPLDRVRFKRRDNGLGSEPLEPYDDLKEETREVELLPQMIDPYQSLVVEVAVVDAEGSPLPYGIYHADFLDPKAGLRCDFEQQWVLRRPETDLDVVDDHIVRYRFHEARGDLGAAGEELRLATERAPNNLKGWYYRGAHAHATGDLEGQLEALKRQRAILGAQNGERLAVSHSIQVLSRDAVSQIDELKARVEAARAVAGTDLVDPGSP